MDPSQSLEAYYQRRANEYDRVYAKPEQQADFAALRAWLAERVAGKAVLEVACGTGHWTAVRAGNATYIVATDINPASEAFGICRFQGPPSPRGVVRQWKPIAPAKRRPVWI